MNITTGTRDHGLYAIRTVGTQSWAEDSWQAHGVRLELMDGLRCLAVCKLEVAGTLEAEERGAEEAQAIEPWTHTMRYLAAAKQLEQRLGHARQLLDEAQHCEETVRGMEEYQAAALRAMATPAELEQADPRDEYDPHAPLAQLIVARLEREVGEGRRKALAFAPDPTVAPVHLAWELPGRLAGMPASSLAREIAQGLLAGWAAMRDLRDPLITWAVKDAEVTRTEVQQTTGVSRSTINRLLPAG